MNDVEPSSSLALRALAVAVLCASLAACGHGADGDGAASPVTGAGVAAEEVGGYPSGTGVPVPDAVLGARAIDPAALELSVSVDGRPLETERDGERWRVSLSGTRGATVTLEIEWSERFRDGELVLATLREEIDTSIAAGSVHIDADEYVTAVHDDDADGRSNLEERSGETDPYNANDPGGAPADGDEEVRVDVRVPAIDPAEAPAVNGSFGLRWDPAAALDADGAALAIDRPLNDAAGAAGAPPGYRWYALHDTESLYVFVTGGEVGDTLSLYVDGDRSRSATLDDGDRHVALPGSTVAGEGQPPAVAPSLAAPVVPPSLEYGFCLCPNGVGGWELKVALDDLGITPGQAFGFELRVERRVDDGSGGTLWGWSDPADEAPGESVRIDAPLRYGTLVTIASDSPSRPDQR